jgi:phosphatidylglycerol:prolipoprotein diacylglycerol transferase
VIPYFEWRIIQLGPLTIQVWGLFAAIGVLLGSWFALRQATRRSLDAEAFSRLILQVIVAAFVGARIFHILFYAPEAYLESPLLALKVWKGGLSSFGGFVGAATVFFLHVRKPGTWRPAWTPETLKKADALTTALSLGLGCGRIGCFLIHDHPGTLSYNILAVKYPGSPPRWDLGMLLGIFDFLLFGLFLLLLRKPRPDGYYFALFMTVYGPVRFFLDFWRVEDRVYWDLTPAQWGSLFLFGAGVTIFARRYRGLGPENEKRTKSSV